MSGTPDLLTHLGGVPVASAGVFAGWWGNDVWFLDNDNGSSAIGAGKNDMTTPQSTLTQTLSDCGPGDTIFVRPRTTVGTQGTNATKIIADTNWTIARTKAHLSIIGTSPNGGDGQILPAVIFQSVGSGTTPTFFVYAPFFTMENCAVFAEGTNPCTQVDGLVNFSCVTPGTHDGYGGMLNNCSFHNYGLGGGLAAVIFNSGRYGVVKNSQFWHCAGGVYMRSAARSVHGNAVRNCDFHGKDTDIDCDIIIGDADHVIIDGCRFHHDHPAKAGGIYDYYVQCTGTAYGMLSNCWFGTETAETATAVSISNMDACGNWCSHSDSTMVT